MSTAIISIIALLIGYWLRKPIMFKKISQIEVKTTEEDTEAQKKQMELQKQFEEMLNYNGSVRR